MCTKTDCATLTIDDEEAIRLLVRLADLTGETLTEALCKALSERLERLRAGAR